MWKQKQLYINNINALLQRNDVEFRNGLEFAFPPSFVNGLMNRGGKLVCFNKYKSGSPSLFTFNLEYWYQ